MRASAGSIAVRLPRRRIAVGGAPLTRGLVVLYLSLMVLIPLAAVVDRSLDNGLAVFWDAVSDPQAVAALKLTLLASLGVADQDPSDQRCGDRIDRRDAQRGEQRQLGRGHRLRVGHRVPEHGQAVV